ncbi:MAG TPA: hypothetical protein VHV50_08005, partial [Actinomycetota bacterium]|nr:hypothetical protein [Actinomycetota bacterium]
MAPFQIVDHPELRPPRAYEGHDVGGVTFARTYWMLIPVGKQQEVMEFFTLGSSCAREAEAGG